MGTAESLAADADPRVPSNMEGIENFTMSDAKPAEKDEELPDADSLFNLPDAAPEEDEES